MRYLFIFALLVSIGEITQATTCLKQFKNCTALSASRRFLDWTPVCVMKVECDVYCGSMKFDRQETKFYCAFQSIKGDDYTCKSVKDCATDESVVKSEQDVARLTKNRVSPGPGHKSSEGAPKGRQ